MPADELRWNTFASIADLCNHISCAGLAFDVEGCDLFSTLEWLTLLESTALTAEAASVICVTNSANSLKALLPLQTGSMGSLFAVRGLRSMSNYYSPLFSAQVAAGLPGKVALDFVCCKLSQASPAWHWLNLEPLSEEGRNELSSSLMKNGFDVFPYFRFGNWFLQLQGRSFADYACELPSQMRNTIARKRRRLDKQGQWEIKLFTGEGQLELGMSAYWQVYNASWKQREPFPEFIDGLIRLAAREGWLRLGILYLDRQPIAAQLWLVYRGTASIYKLAYDKHFKKLSAGSILSEYMFEQVIDGDGVDEIDYLMGDEAYKRDWMSARRERWGLMAFNRATLTGRGLAGIERIKRKIKSVSEAK